MNSRDTDVYAEEAVEGTHAIWGCERECKPHSCGRKSTLSISKIHSEPP